MQTTADSGFFVRAFAGYSRMLASTGWRCLGNCDGYRNEIAALPYAGLTLGTSW